MRTLPIIGVTDAGIGRKFSDFGPPLLSAFGPYLLETTTLPSNGEFMQSQLNEMAIDEHAFIFFRNPQYRLVNNGTTGIIMFFGEWVNSGRTPPFGLKVWRVCGTKSEYGLPPDFAAARKTYRPTGLLVVPGSFITEELTGAVWEGYMKSADFIVCFGEATYDDSAHGPHHTEFCYQGDWINRNGPIPFNFVQCDGHNCADDDCKKD